MSASYYIPGWRKHIIPKLVRGRTVGPEVPDHLELNKFKASLAYMKPCVNIKQQNYINHSKQTGARKLCNTSSQQD